MDISDKNLLLNRRHLLQGTGALALAAAFAVFAAWNESRIHVHLGRHQMFPLIPSGVPKSMEDGGVEPKSEPAAHVAAQRPVLIEIAVA